MEVTALIGKSPEGLQLSERTALVGKWIALELYTPETLPLKEIIALGDTPEECIRELSRKGLDPTRFEFQLMTQPY